MVKTRPSGSRIRPFAVGVLLLVSALWSSPTRATQVRSIDLEEMTARAATIFSGRVVGIRHEHDELLGIGVTFATFRVDQAVKGRLGTTVELKFLGGGESGQGLAGMPTFRVGEEVVLFLYGTSRLGLTSPVGLGQGKFTVVTDKHGRKLAINEFRNANLAGESATGGARSGRSPGSLEAVGHLEPSRLLDLTRQLVREERARANR